MQKKTETKVEGKKIESHKQHISNPSNEQLPGEQIHSWQICLRNYFLKHKSVQRQEINEELTLDVQTHYKENETFQYTNFYLSHPPRKD